MAVLILFSSAGYAQQQDKTVLNDAVTDIYIVGASGLVGAVLGLSTLSFVEKPSDHLNNIVMGGALGIIVGVIIVSWSETTKPREFFDTGTILPPMQPSSERSFTTLGRYRWHRGSHFRHFSL